MEQSKQGIPSGEGTQKGTADQIDPHDIGYPFFPDGKILGLEPFPDTIFTTQGSDHEPTSITSIRGPADVRFGSAEANKHFNPSPDKARVTEGDRSESDLEYPPTSFELLEQVLDGSPETDRD